MKKINKLGRGTRLIPIMFIIMMIISGIGSQPTAGGKISSDSQPSLSITTNKSIYYLIEPINISIDGSLEDYVLTMEPSLLITNDTGNNVFESLFQCIPRNSWISLPYTWIWNQKYKLYDNRGYGLGKEIPPSGEQVPPGKYYAWFDYDGVNKVGPAEFEIIKPGLTATIDIDPNTLNLKSKGKWITCYIELPEGFDVNDIEIGSIRLGNVIFAEWGDIQNDILMVKFDRSEVEDMLPPGTYNLKVTGELADGTLFKGYSDGITVINPPKK
ncbi:MAG: hypothetical protein JSW00_15430 [Thermoplasmata archaeon]|nr:MAG: hypothetical protein JSW00_15430 [Thermoplasmata archaeon]